MRTSLKILLVVVGLAAATLSASSPGGAQEAVDDKDRDVIDFGAAVHQAVAPGDERQGADNIYVLLDANDQFGTWFDWDYQPAFPLGLGDDGEIGISIGFTFHFYDQPYTTVYVGANGGLVFDSSSNVWAINQTLDAVSANTPGIYPFWDDLDPSDPNSDGVYYETFGPPDERVLVIEWRNIVHYQGGPGETIRFQVRLFENKDRIEFHYADVVHGGGDAVHDLGATATIGIDGGASTPFLEYSFDSGSLSDGFAVDFWRATCGAAAASTVGTRGDDTASVAGGHSYYGHFGDDTITLAGTGSSACGGHGNDTLRSNAAGPASLFGEGDFYYDRARWFSGDDRIDGTDFDDFLSGGPGSDTIFGSGGDDTLFGEHDAPVTDSSLSPALAPAGEDQLHGGPGNDGLYGGGAFDTLFGNEDDDLLIGGPDFDALNGGLGNDRIFGHAPAGTWYCTAGCFIVVGFDPGGDIRDLIDGGSGDDEIRSGPGDDEVRAGPGRDRVWGGSGNDEIFGGSEIDDLRGQTGRDVIHGEGGSDRILGGSDSDTVYAGSGADRVFGGPGDDILNGMGGQDKMWGDDGDDVMQGNWQSDWMFGGNGADVIRGAAGKDKLFGEAGDDQLFGGVNTDFLDGGPGFDVANGQLGKDNPLIALVSGCIAEVRISC